MTSPGVPHWDAWVAGRAAAAVAAAAGSLTRLGLRRGTRVGVDVTLSAAHLPAGDPDLGVLPLLAAISQLGAVPVPLSAATTREMRRVLAACRVDAVLPGSGMQSLAQPATGSGAEGDPAGPGPRPGTVQGAPGEVIFCVPDGPEGPTCRRFSPATLIAGARTLAGHLGLAADDRMLVRSSPATVAGFCAALAGLSAGAVIDLRPGPAEGVIRRCRQDGVSVLVDTPAGFAHLAATRQLGPGGVDAPGVRVWLGVGPQISPPVVQRLREVLPMADPVLLHGSAEVVATAAVRIDGWDGGAELLDTPLPGQTVSVRRPDGTETDPGEVGELEQSGDLVCDGPPDRPRPGTPVRTGDLATRSESGQIRLAGRADQLIVAGGMRFSPDEVEEVACASGFVGEATAFGITDENQVQQVVLAVTAPLDGRCRLADLDILLREVLPSYMVPSLVVELPELPRTGTGAVDRHQLRLVVG
ncbi:AMP-binding protein [Nakamurella sp. YIM 132087]|uniref:AMP-binding protein n=1 Tax=Nakamurella alba TaxID=2665158 RepID=A0A7K1FMG7_9ACTN|nr:AMP-binding protein [Nakamurella alba]MTD15357.1 AMP-binding protein [Nakamurella alba]